jgi:hypothetical protein
VWKCIISPFLGLNYGRSDADVMLKNFLAAMSECFVPACWFNWIIYADICQEGISDCCSELDRFDNPMVDLANRQKFLLDKKFFLLLLSVSWSRSNKFLMRNAYNPCASNKLMHNDQAWSKILAQELLNNIR